MAAGKWIGNLVFKTAGLCVPRSGVATVSAGNDTANLINISTGFTVVTQFQITVLRAGKIIQTDIDVSIQTGGIIRVADGATFVLTSGDVIHWMATGTY